MVLADHLVFCCCIKMTVWILLVFLPFIHEIFCCSTLRVYWSGVLGQKKMECGWNGFIWLLDFCTAHFVGFFISVTVHPLLHVECSQTNPWAVYMFSLVQSWKLCVCFCTWCWSIFIVIHSVRMKSVISSLSTPKCHSMWHLSTHILLFSFPKMQNRMAVLLCNLKPAKMRGVVSQAMVMCASSPEKVEILAPPPGAVAGDRITFEGFPGKQWILGK